MTSKQYQLVLFGATSFVGKITAHYLVDRLGINQDFKWAITARSKSKLEALQAELTQDGQAPDMILADAMKPEDMVRLCSMTDAVASTVGPYALYGEGLVKACAESGTDYCDLTGETPWIRRMFLKYEEAAIESGARIVHCCGFDSIPSDLGVLFLQQESQKRFGKACKDVRMRVKAWSGGVSGGTIASLLNVTKEATADAKLRKELANPYSLCPPDHTYTHRQPRFGLSTYDDKISQWVGPFVMESINTRVVHRSNALLESAYSPTFTYQEGMMMGSGISGRLAANGMGAGLGGFIALTAIGPIRQGLERFVLPAPGEGPSPEQQEKGFYNLYFYGITDDNERINVKVTGDRDPGYGSTAKMLSESAILFSTIPNTMKGGRFWTPATMYGDLLINRLIAHAGLTFEVIEG